jgi:hypothetical protein
MDPKTLKAVFKQMQSLKDEELENPTEEASIESVRWYENNAIEVYRDTFKVTESNSRFKNRLLSMSTRDYGDIPRYSGRMYTFAYQPETEKNLDYWDMYPLVIRMIEADEKLDSFLGINLHYLYPEKRRAVLMSLITNYASGDLSNKNTRISFLESKKLQSLPNRYARPCIRRYKYSNIRGRALMIPPEHWLKMIFLPTYQFTGSFMGTGPKKAWKDTWIRYQKGGK